MIVPFLETAWRDRVWPDLLLDRYVMGPSWMVGVRYSGKNTIDYVYLSGCPSTVGKKTQDVEIEIVDPWHARQMAYMIPSVEPDTVRSTLHRDA